jgi:predicted transcriptional regulator
MTQTLSGEVAANIRAELARQKVSQSQVAEVLGVSQAAVSRRLSGALPFELDEIAAVADLLNVRARDLILAGAA